MLLEVKNNGQAKRKASCGKCQLQGIMGDMTTINERLRLLDAMYTEKRERKRELPGAATISKKVREIDRRVGRFTKKLQSNGKETE